MFGEDYQGLLAAKPLIAMSTSACSGVALEQTLRQALVTHRYEVAVPSESYIHQHAKGTEDAIRLSISMSGSSPTSSSLAGPSRRLVTEQPTIWRMIPYIDGVSEEVSRILGPLRIGIAHRPESTIRHPVMRPKAPLPRGEITNVNYRIQCNSCEVNYIGETGKRLQTRIGEHKMAVKRVDHLSLVAEHCAHSEHTFAFQHAEILGRVNDRIARETIEAWHMGTISINRRVALPNAYQVLRAQFSEQMSRPEPKLNMNPNMSEAMADTHSVVPQPGSDVGTVVTTAVSSTSPEDEKTDRRCGINKIAILGQLKSMKIRTTAANVPTPAPDVD
ncbi:hypothetical protein SprV_0501817800 [Sparganum proliferum]